MHITLRYFAALRETIGREHEEIELPDAANITLVRTLLAQQYPPIATILTRCVAARNRVLAADDVVLAEHDELVFLPPMAGGL